MDITQCLSLKLRLINECLHVTLFIFRRVQIFRKKKRLKLIFLHTDLMLKWREEEEKIWRSVERTEGGTCWDAASVPQKLAAPFWSVCLCFTIWAFRPANAVWLIFNLGHIPLIFVHIFDHGNIWNFEQKTNKTQKYKINLWFWISSLYPVYIVSG